MSLPGWYVTPESFLVTTPESITLRIDEELIYVVRQVTMCVLPAGTDAATLQAVIDEVARR